MTNETQTITYVLVMSDKSLRKITVPKEWTITYGQLMPGISKNDRYNQGAAGYGVRFYEGKKTTGKAMAAIGGVIEFYPDTIAISEQVIETKRQSYGDSAPEGFKNSTVEAKVVSWRNINEPVPVTPENNRFLAEIKQK